MLLINIIKLLIIILNASSFVIAVKNTGSFPMAGCSEEVTIL